MGSDSSNQSFDNAEEMQRAHYDRISKDYEIHYGDQFSQDYRRRFMLESMIRGISLEGKSVLDAMCGSGESTPLLVESGAHVTGLDISPIEIGKFSKRLPSQEVMCSSILDTGLPNESFDVVCIFGGLHHLHPNLFKALTEMDRILKPGGYLIFTEPHAKSIPEFFRQLWYRVDPLFMENEKGVDIDEMKSHLSDRYSYEVEEYCGSAAYLLVLNSMIFRIPHGWKSYYSEWMMRAERLIQKFQGPLFSCYVNCRWRKSG